MMADIVTSVLGSRNLSQSSLITRNLYSTLTVGAAVHRSPGVTVEDVTFRAASLAEYLVISLTNGQTQTMMYVRNVPLRLVTGASTAVILWVAVFAPGDPRNDTFDEAAVPRADAPQVQLSLRQVTRATPGIPSTPPLQRASLDLAVSSTASPTHAAGALPLSLEHARGLTTAPADRPSRPSQLDLEALAIREKERQAEDVKKKMAEMAGLRRQAQSAEAQLQDASREVEEMRQKVEMAEQELQELSVRRSALERDKQLAREDCERAREALQSRNLALVELRNKRDDADRQLTMVLTEHRQHQEELDVTQRAFNDEAKALGAELERWRAEASDLTAALQRCDQRVRELQEQGDRAVHEGTGGEELRALQLQLDEAVRELDSVRQNAATEAAGLREAEEQCQEARSRLSQAESAAASARTQLADQEAVAEKERHRQIESRAEADAVQREILAQIGRAAQLDGQVAENQNQIRDMELSMKEFMTQVDERRTVHNDLESTITSLRDQVEVHEVQGESMQNDTAELKVKLRTLQDETDDYRRKVTELESSRRDIELANTRRVDELDSTRTVVGGELERISSEAARLRSRKAELQSSMADAEAQAASHARELEETQARALTAEQELTATNSECGRREKDRGDAARRLAELEVDLEEARRQLASAEDEAEKLRKKSQAQALERQQKEQTAEAMIAVLRSELDRHRASSDVAASDKQSLSSSAEEARRLAAERNQQLQHLKSLFNEESARLEKERLKSSLDESRRNLVQQAELVTKLQAKLENQRLELGTASSDASSGQAREAELRRSLDVSRASHADKSAAARLELGEVKSKHSAAADELARMREQRSQMQRQLAELLSNCQEARACLDTMSSQNQAAEDTAEQLKAMQAECAKCAAEEAKLNQKGSELEQRLVQMETKLSEERTVQKEMEADLNSKRMELRSVKADLERCSSDVAAAFAATSAEAAGLSDLQGRATMLEKQSEELRKKIAAAEAAAARASELRQECEAARRKKQERQEESGRRLASHDAELQNTRQSLQKAWTDMVSEKNNELDQRIACIDELERTVMSLSSTVEGFSGASQQQLLERLRVAEALEKEAQTDVADHMTKLSVFQQELKVLEDMKEQLQRRVIAAEAKVASAEEASSAREKEARERAEQLKELRATAAKSAEDCEARVKSVLSEVFLQEQQNLESVGVLADLGNQATMLRRQRDKAKQHLQECENQYEAQCSSLSTVQLEQQAIEAERRVAISQAQEQMVMLNELEEELVRLGSLEQHMAAEEQKVKLLQDQLAGRQEQQRTVEAEVKSLEVIRGDLMAELAKEQGLLRQWEDKLAFQVEHSNIQFSTFEQLEEETRILENESEILTLGVHGVVQRAEFLEKENSLMKQKMEGLYDGTLQDWAAEVHQIKVASELEHHKAEVSSWKEIAQKAERELQADLSAMRRQNEEAEAGLRRKLEALREESRRLERKLQEQDDATPEVSGSVHSVPATLHGLVAPVLMLPAKAQRRRALLIGCNYAKSHRPLQGCANDVLSMQCLLRHSLQYGEDKVRTLSEGSSRCPSPLNRLPTKANILEGIQWLTASAAPGDNLFFYFTGYGTQQPVKFPHREDDSLCEAYFVPDDFAADLPSDFFASAARRSSTTGLSYRLVPLLELSNAILRLPPQCKVTVVLDCCHSVLPNVTHVNPAPATFRRVVMEPMDSVPRKANSSLASQPRLLDLPPLVMMPTRGLPGVPHCCCHCYSACQSEQWCAEFPIEGCVQGAFTWTFIKALTAGHLQGTVHQHGKALHSILDDLRYHFRWIEQTPVMQLSGSAKLQDKVLVS